MIVCDLRNELMLFLYEYAIDLEMDVDVTIESGAADIMAILEECDYKKVVRCEDCEHYHKRDDYNPLQMETHCKMTGLATDGNDYCSYAVRKDGE